MSPARPCLTILLALALAVPMARAQGAAVVPAPVKPETGTKAEPVLELPKIQVTASRIKKLDKEIKRLDKLITRETEKVKSTDLDRTLNNASISRAAAIFGGNSSDHLSAVAATRVALLENERDVLEAMKRPATLDELAMMEKELQQLRLTRRNLDDASKQR